MNRALSNFIDQRSKKILQQTVFALLAAGFLAASAAQARVVAVRQFHDQRYQHNHFYPARGYVTHVMPRERVVVYRGRDRYYFSGGAWYRPYGPRFRVVGPPLGLFVPLLPSFYTTVWFNRAPYYYANDTYYRWRAERRGYEIVPAPREYQASTSGPADDAPYVYPNNGQSSEQVGRDRYECYAWAVNQTGFDPAAAANGTRSGNDRDGYQRAYAACLTGRGYSVR